MFRKRSKADGGPTLIAADTKVEGDIEYSGELIVSGAVKGTVSAADGSPAALIVSAKGRIEGEVRVPRVEIHGEVMGDVFAGEHLKLAPGARITGDVHYEAIEMAEGAEINGRLLHAARPPLTERQAAELGKGERASSGSVSTAGLTARAQSAG